MAVKYYCGGTFQERRLVHCFSRLLGHCRRYGFKLEGTYLTCSWWSALRRLTALLNQWSEAGAEPNTEHVGRPSSLDEKSNKLMEINDALQDGFQAVTEQR